MALKRGDYWRMSASPSDVAGLNKLRVQFIHVILGQNGIWIR